MKDPLSKLDSEQILQLDRQISHAKYEYPNRTQPARWDGETLTIHLLRAGERCPAVPLIEANATASESLSRLAEVEQVQDPVQKILDQKEIERAYQAVLATNAKGLEHSVLLHLARVHFPDLTLKEQLALSPRWLGQLAGARSSDHPASRTPSA